MVIVKALWPCMVASDGIFVGVFIGIGIVKGVGGLCLTCSQHLFIFNSIKS